MNEPSQTPDFNVPQRPMSRREEMLRRAFENASPPNSFWYEFRASPINQGATMESVQAAQAAPTPQPNAPVSMKREDVPELDAMSPKKILSLKLSETTRTMEDAKSRIEEYNTVIADTKSRLIAAEHDTERLKRAIAALPELGNQTYATIDGLMEEFDEVCKTHGLLKLAIYPTIINTDDYAENAILRLEAMSRPMIVSCNRTDRKFLLGEVFVIIDAYLS